jgi:hypothetical protein
MPRNSNVVPMIEPVICAWTIRAGDLRLDDPSVRPGEDEEGQYQFGGVAKADVD